MMRSSSASSATAFSSVSSSFIPCPCGEHRRGKLFSGFDGWWRAAGGSFIGDDLAQILNAVLGKGGHAILPETVNPETAVFGEHVDRQLVQPVFVLAEQIGDVADREDGCDCRQDQAA